MASAIEAKDFEKAMSLRDHEFKEHLANFMAMNTANHENQLYLVKNVRRLPLSTSVLPAGGMNSAVYAMATYCMSRGHTPYAIHNGFAGLSRHESVKLIEWIDIEGGTALGV